MRRLVIITRRYPITQRRELLLSGLLGLYWAWQLWLTALLPTEDAFITYRYAEKLSAGKGLVYNAGEHVLGTTTPLFALLLGGLHSLTGFSIPLIAHWISILAVIITVSLLMVWLKRLSLGSVSPLALLAVSLSPIQYGMEGPLFIMLVVLALFLLRHEHDIALLLLLPLLPLVRPEGLFLIALIILYVAFNRRMVISLLFTSIISLSILGIALLVTFYYGSPIPQSIVAKQAGVYPVGLLGSTVGTLALLIEILTGINFVYGYTNTSLILAGSSLVLFVVCIYRIFQLLRRLDRVLALIPIFVAIVLVFYALSNTLIFDYYAGNVGYLVRLIWIAGLGLIGRSVFARHWTAPLLLLIILGPQLLHPVTQKQIITAENNRQLLYREIAEEVRPLLDTDSVLLLPEIGEIGFALPGVHILDAAGLVSPEAIPYLPVSTDQRPGLGVAVIPPQMVRDYQPDMIITLDTFILFGLDEDPWFQEHYHALITRPVQFPGWQSRYLYVFVFTKATNCSMLKDEFEIGIYLKSEDLADKTRASLKLIFGE